MDTIKQYKKYIVENKMLVLFSILLTILIRLAFFYFSDVSPYAEYKGEGYLWSGAVTQFFSDKLISLVISTLFVFFISFYASQINAKHALIRNRSYLIYILGPLMLSLHQVFILMSTYYVAALAFLMCLDLLYSSYQDESSNKNAYAIGFVIGVSSLFSFYSLMYLPLFWIGFAQMRIFNFKNLIISVLGVASIYWPLFVFFLWKDRISDFLSPFEHSYPVFCDSIDSITFLGHDLLAAIAFFLLIIVSIDYQTNSFKDKIRTRANIRFLHLATLFSILSFYFVLFDSTLNLYILSCSSTILLAHFFSLTEQKWKMIFYYILIVVYLSCCLLNLLN